MSNSSAPARHRLVPVWPNTYSHHDLVTCGRTPGRPMRTPSVVTVRRMCSTGEAYRTISSTAGAAYVSKSRCHSWRCSGKLVMCEQAVTDGVAGRLIAGADEQVEERAELLRAELLTVGVLHHEAGEEIVVRVAQPILGELLDEADELGAPVSRLRRNPSSSTRWAAMSSPPAAARSRAEGRIVIVGFTSGHIPELKLNKPRPAQLHGDGRQRVLLRQRACSDHAGDRRPVACRQDRASCRGRVRLRRCASILPTARRAQGAAAEP